MRIQVDCKGGSEPRAFYLSGQRLDIMRILERAAEDSQRRYRVSVADGRVFVLRQDLVSGDWRLARVTSK